VDPLALLDTPPTVIRTVVDRTASEVDLPVTGVTPAFG